MFSFNIQRLVHWLDIGEGKKVLAVLALVAFVLLFSAYHSYKRFAGPQTEYVIQQTLIGKHLAKGDGFATSVVFPQTVAVLEKLHNLSFDRDQALPDFYHAPLYPAVIAGGLLLIPESLESLLWEDPYFVGDVIPTGFNADYYVLVISLIFFWISCLMVYFLGRRLYSPRGGLISLFGVLFSVGLWDQVMAVTGISILVCLILLIFFLWSFLESARLEGEAHALPKYFMPVSFGVGLTGGLIFLTEYSAGLVLDVFLGYAFFSYRGRDLLKIVLPAVIGFLLLATPWLARNVYWTGHPLGLAGQNLALRVGDSTAEPEYFRKAMTSEGPKISLRKIGNKGLKGIEENIRNHFWSGGSYLFAAFFLTGILYRFRNPVTNHLRWYMAISVIVLLLFQPFLNSGESMRIPMFYLSPLVIILGAGFFLVMLESTGRRSFWEVTLSIIVLLLLHGLPLAHNLLEPRRVPFTFPPYVLSVLVRTRTMVTEKFFPGYGIMSDIPAGTAWYSQQFVWAQPEEYPDFVKVLIRQDIGALFRFLDVFSGTLRRGC